MLSLTFHKECQHQLGLPEIECQKDSPPFDRLNYIHLHYRCVCISFHVGREIIIGPSYTIALINPFLRSFLTLLVADLTRKVDVPECEQRKIAIIVESALGNP